jgi:hypothetical protein
VKHAERSEGAKDPQKRQPTDRACVCHLGDRTRTIGRDPVCNAQIGHNAKHSGELKAAQHEIEL